ncbi:signal peptide peptidase SppA [Porphyromonas circumdentaria]|uniref:Protease-4 n=1 Tax=Porphyromonas circumdentaria TaxID=29524 RepID=A0A1T4N638_9PORP|nr:signal peptide peptidase SppA [Porphyromonas circumdentaria]MBB6276052.1 protease-4 [Porphyromonas circumdentaria]SJZ74770.1 protease-4 [Porphyromonas circumdentaria]
MKDFLKMFLAAVLAFFVGSVIISCLSIILLIGFVASTSISTQGAPVKIESGSVLEVNFSNLQEKVATTPFDDLFGSSDKGTLSLTDVIASIRKAKDNPNIEGILLTANIPSGGMASISEVRKALQEFKSSGKFIIAYADIYNQKGYYLASVADKIYLNPQGMIELNGIYVSNVFFKKALENLGVEMQVFKVGTYKGAVEPFLLDRLSEPNREQITSFSSALWDNLLEGIAKERKIEVATLQAFADRGPVFLPQQEYLENKLVDSLLFKREVMDLLKAKDEVDDDMKLVSLTNMNRTKGYTPKGNDKVGVLFAEGAIMAGKERGTITEELAQRLIDIADEDEIDAVVLRVNSPGGSSFVSEQIWDAVQFVKSKKPIVVSMGDFAASGGYYISCASSYIFAEPTTITGSIGIYGIFPNFAGTAKKLSLTEDGVKTAKYADFGNAFRPMREDEKEIMQRYIELGYDTFITRVADGRKLTKEQVDNVGQGRVWTGSQALQHGLVDGLGGLDEAIEKAAELAEITSYTIEYEKTYRDRFEELFSSLSYTVSQSILERVLTKEEIEALKETRSYRENAGVQARLMYNIKM